jgi:hypothetical protein
MIADAVVFGCFALRSLTLTYEPIGDQSAGPEVN